MKQFKLLGIALATAALVSACGGGADGDQTPAVKFSSVVSFGDSLSDAGTYSAGLLQAGIIKSAAAGGMFTVNGIAGALGADPVPSYNWAQLVSAALTGKASCAARSGGFGLAATAVANCTNYAQGGARVVDPKGVGNPVGAGFTAGPLTEPVTSQIANYIAAGGQFSSHELFTVLAGANDLFGQIDKLTKDATAAGGGAFVTSLATQLAADASTPATAASAIGGAFVSAKTAGASDTLAVSAAIQAAAAAGNSKVMDMVYINTVMGAAQTAATTAGATAFGSSLVTQLIAGLAPANQAGAGAAIGAAIQTAATASGATPTSITTAAATAAALDAASNSYSNANLANVAAIGASAGLAANSAAAGAFATSVVAALAPDTSNPTSAATAIASAMTQAQTAAAQVPGATSTTILTAAGNAAIQAAAAAGNTKVMNMTYINATVASATTAASTAGNNFAATTGAATAVAGMQTAAVDLATAIKGMLAKGAKYITVVNVPDVSQTPMALATTSSQQQLVLAMTSAFNAKLKVELESAPGVTLTGVLLVDAFAENQRQLANPAHYALSNVKDVACNLTSPANALASADKADGSSLVCNPSNLIAGDTSHYLFADNVHPTPYGHKLLAQYVTKALVQAGWL